MLGESEAVPLCFMMKSSESIPEVGAKCLVTQFALDIHLLMSEEDICEFWRLRRKEQVPGTKEMQTEGFGGKEATQWKDLRQKNQTSSYQSI